MMHTKKVSRNVVFMIRASMLMMLSLCTVILNPCDAQVFWTEGFGTGCSQAQLAVNASFPNGAWTEFLPGANDPFANEWYISATEAGLLPGNCRDGCLNTPGQLNQTLHVGNVPGSPNSATLCVPGDCGAIYDPGGVPFNQVTTSKRIESPVIDCTGKNTITISFNYFENGEALNDNATLWYYDGTSWAQIADPAKTSTTNCTGGAGYWTAFSTTLPASANNNPAVKIGFLWVNNDVGGVGTNPSFAVDEIALSTTPLTVVADFSVDSLNTGCAGQPRLFTDISSGNPTGWVWSFPGGNPNSSTLQNPVVTYATAGTYTVLFAAYNSSDTDTIIRTNYITILDCMSPTADFVASNTVICQNHCINFTDLSQGTPTGWQWSFQAGTPSTSTAQNPLNICYSTPGVYNVQLIVSNQFGGDTIIKPSYITVNSCPPPVADFSQSSTGGCDTVCIDFNDLSTGTPPPNEWHWYFPGATPDSSNAQYPTNVCYDSDGLYDVMLVVGNGNGYDTTIHYSAVNISSVPTATVHGDTIMAFGGRDTLSAAGGISYFWFVPGVGDSTQWGLDTNYTDTVVVSPQFTTTYNVLITDAFGCHTYRQVTVVITRVNRLFIPNAFAPEAGREPNSTFRIFGNNIFSAKLVVFDRWGEKVFETNNKDAAWDGTYNGKKLNAGVYTYYAAVIFDNSESPPQIQTGTIALIR